MSRPLQRRGAQPWDPERVEVVAREPEPPPRLDAVPGHVTLRLDPEAADRLVTIVRGHCVLPGGTSVRA